MKIFAVYARVKLLKKPDWLEDFRMKYDEPYDFHITLKQACFINEKQIPLIKEKLKKVFSNFSVPNYRINLIFDKKVVDDKIKDDACIMLFTENKEIRNLQKVIKSSLSDYKNYYEPKLEEYENNFNPHISIARDLNSKTLSKAISEIKDDFICEGMIEEIVLVIVNKKSVKESLDPKNLTIYRI
jgi:2'-5' RNA ligase